jgi:hypothetical protein
MKNFIKLSSIVINKLHIIQIVKKPNIYEIHMIHNKIEGMFFCGSGIIDTKSNMIKICEKKDKEDYDIITDLIDLT